MRCDDGRPVAFSCCIWVTGRNSATGTRTRVARVKAEYPNQLDYSGSCGFGSHVCWGRAGAPDFAFLTHMTPAGLELAIPDSVGRCFIRWAAGPLMVPMCKVAFAAVVALRLFLFAVSSDARIGLVTSACASIAQLVRA